MSATTPPLAVLTAPERIYLQVSDYRGDLPDAFEAAYAGAVELWQYIPDPAAPTDPQPYERDERDYVHHTTAGAAG